MSERDLRLTRVVLVLCVLGTTSAVFAVDGTILRLIAIAAGLATFVSLSVATKRSRKSYTSSKDKPETVRQPRQPPGQERALGSVMRFSFTIGTAEQHLVEFSRDWVSGKVRVTVDGAEALSRVDPPLSIERTRRYELSVGDGEPHAVVIEKERPLLLGGLRSNTYRVLVDGQLIGTQEGR